MELTSALIEDSRCTQSYLILVIASAAIATFGLLENNVAAIIGAMVIAPLMSPIQALAFGAISGNQRLFRGGLFTLAVGTLVSAALAALLQACVFFPTFGSEIVARSKPTLLDLGIAIAAGAVAGFAKVRPSISSTVGGTAIAVALMPPVCVFGIALAAGQEKLAFGAFLLYVTNLLGIAVACMVVYLVAGHVKSLDHRALGTAIALGVILLFPLAASLVNLLRSDRIESVFRSALVQDTVTFKHVDLVQMNVNWLSNPAVATLTVRSTEPITPTQVADLEAFAYAKTKVRFEIVFEVTPLVEVKGATPAP